MVRDVQRSFGSTQVIDIPVYRYFSKSVHPFSNTLTAGSRNTQTSVTAVWHLRDCRRHILPISASLPCRCGASVVLSPVAFCVWFRLRFFFSALSQRYWSSFFGLSLLDSSESSSQSYLTILSPRWRWAFRTVLEISHGNGWATDVIYRKSSSSSTPCRNRLDE